MSSSWSCWAHHSSCMWINWSRLGTGERWRRTRGLKGRGRQCSQASSEIEGYSIAKVFLLIGSRNPLPPASSFQYLLSAGMTATTVHEWHAHCNAQEQRRKCARHCYKWEVAWLWGCTPGLSMITQLGPWWSEAIYREIGHRPHHPVRLYVA